MYVYVLFMNCLLAKVKIDTFYTAVCCPSYSVGAPHTPVSPGVRRTACSFVVKKKKTMDRRHYLEESTIRVFGIFSQSPIFLYHGNDNDDGGNGAYLPGDNFIKHVLVLKFKKNVIFNLFNITSQPFFVRKYCHFQFFPNVSYFEG